MQIDEKTYFEEEQKMDSKWIWFFVLFFCLLLAGVGVAFLLDDNSKTNVPKISWTLGIIVLSDLFLLYIFKTMKLEIALSKKGFHYSFFALLTSKGIIEWNQISKISITKSPYKSYGKKYSFKNGEVYTMNSKMGVTLVLLSGKKKFFSIQDIDTFRSAYTKLQLPHPIE